MTSPSSSLGLARPCAVLPGAGATIPGATGLTAPHGAQAKGANTANQGTAEQVFFQSGPARPGCDGKLKVLDLFSGIGGFSLGLERAGGFETVAFCEIEEFPRKVLRKHWPEVPIYNDVRTLTADVLARDGIAVDVITGGFPCQDLSVAGKQRGMGEGTRSGLWSEIVRLIGELRPRYVIVENVAALLSGPSNQRGGWFGRILGDLAECGYDAEWENIPASALGDPHRRERVWIVAYPNGDGLEAKPAKAVLFDEAGDSRLPGRLSQMDSQKIWIGTRPIGAVPMAMGDGVSEWLGDIKGAGNAVVPQIPELIGRAIMAAEGITASAGIAAGAFPVEGGASAHDAAALFSPCETPGAAVPGFFSLQKRLMP